METHHNEIVGRATRIRGCDRPHDGSWIIRFVGCSLLLVLTALPALSQLGATAGPTPQAAQGDAKATVRVLRSTASHTVREVQDPSGIHLIGGQDLRRCLAGAHDAGSSEALWRLLRDFFPQCSVQRGRAQGSGGVRTWTGSAVGRSCEVVFRRGVLAGPVAGWPQRRGYQVVGRVQAVLVARSSAT